MRLFPSLFVAFLACTAVVHGQPQLLVLEPEKDNSLYQDASGSLSNGAGTGLFVGQTAQGGNIDLRRALLEFDPSPIPANATILSVQLDIVLNSSQGFGQPLSLHRVNAEWGEGTSIAPGGQGAGGAATAGDATWIHRFFPTDFWTSPGGDFVATASATAVGGSSTTFASTGSLIDDVTDFILDPSQNHGWIIIGLEGMPGASAGRYASRESLSPLVRPKLTIEWAPELPPVEFRRVDCNSNGGFELNDAVALLSFLFTGGAAPTCQDACDADDNGGLNLSDVIAILGTLFGGDVPASPYPLCGEDVEVDQLPECMNSGCP